MTEQTTGDWYQERSDRIIDNPDLSKREQKRAMRVMINELTPKRGKQEEPKSKAKHWPGRYKPELDGMYYALSWSNDRDISVNREGDVYAGEIRVYQLTGICCETEEEAEFVKAHLEARSKLIETLEELNENWRPDWANSEELKCEPVYNQFYDSMEVLTSATSSYLPDWFQGKSRQVWLDAIEKLGIEKVKLALWPRYEEPEEPSDDLLLMGRSY
jgi:hypothetical protein